MLRPAPHRVSLPAFRRASPLPWIAGIAGALWLIFPFGYPNYDTAYSLLLGDELAHGASPDYGPTVFRPTPHPLAQVWGIVVSPLGAQGASDVTTVLAYLALGAATYLVYRVGSLWFDGPIGFLAAAIFVTREPVLSRGLRAYIDLPYIALLLGALAIETRRPRAGWPVLALLSVAGVLRPEAWLFSAAYLGYMALESDPQGGRFALRRRRALDRRDLAGLAILAAAAPVAWAAFDWITVGDPFYAYTETQATAPTQTGLAGLVHVAPRRLGEVMQIPGLVGAAAGIGLALVLMRRRALIGVVAAVLGGAAFAILAVAGLPIQVRYAMPTATILCIFCAFALLGWRLLAADHPWRRGWQVIAVAVAVVFVVQAPRQHDRLSTARTLLDHQSAVEADLRHIADSGAFEDRCRPLTVPVLAAIPRVAGWLDIRPSEIVYASGRRPPRHGYYLDPSNEVPGYSSGASVPPRFQRVARNESWVLYARCGRRAANTS